MMMPSDATTQLILDFNLKDAGQDLSIREACCDWRYDVDSNSDLGVVYENEEQMVQGLYGILQDYWNDWNDRAETFLEEYDGGNDAIEELYAYWIIQSGNNPYKDTIEDKLDFIWYKQTEEEFIKMLDWEELDMDYWG